MGATGATGATGGTGPTGPTGPNGTQSFTVPIGDGSNVIQTGDWVDVKVPANATVTGWTLTGTKYISGSTGSMVCDIEKTTYSNFPSSFASITASAKPTISAASKGQSSTLTGWTTTLTAGDILRIQVDSCSTITLATLTIDYVRT